MNEIRLYVTKNILAECKFTLKAVNTRIIPQKVHSLTFQGGLQINWKRPNIHGKVTLISNLIGQESNIVRNRYGRA